MRYICNRKYGFKNATMLNSKDFTKRLEKILNFYGLTASALAEEIDFNRSTISHLVSGRNKPSLEFVMKLLQKFPEITMDWLVFGKGSFPSDGASKSVEKIQKPDPTPTLKKPQNLISEAVQEPEKLPELKSGSQQIDRIVIFYADGTFKAYEN